MILAIQIMQKYTSIGQMYKHHFMQMLIEGIQILVLNGMFAGKFEYRLVIFFVLPTFSCILV